MVRGDSQPTIRGVSQTGDKLYVLTLNGDEERINSLGGDNASVENDCCDQR